MLDYIALFYSPHSVNARLQPQDCQAFVQRIEELSQQGRGVIVLCAHLANPEYSGWLLSRLRGEVSIVYSEQPNRWLNKRLLHLRQQIMGLNMCPASRSGVRQMLQSLRQGHTVMMLADQKPRRAGSHAVASFMGAEALSPVLIPALARRTGAPALAVAVVQSQNQRKLRVLTSEVSADLAHEDAAIATRAQNQALERLIAQAPEQYLWSYRRYGRTPEMPHNPYKP